MKIMNEQLQRRRARVRAKVSGTAERPRLSVTITNRHITAQIIDDTKSHTLVYITTNVPEYKNAPKGTMTEKAVWTGEKIAELAKQRKIKQVVMDRNGKIYHGRLHALAEAARAKGLEF